MKEKLLTAVKNIVWLMVLDLIALPAGVFLYLTHGFHIVHVILGMVYIHGLMLVFDTAKILLKYTKFIDENGNGLPVDDESYFETDEDQYETDEELKPEMQKAMDEVFGIKH